MQMAHTTAAGEPANSGAPLVPVPHLPAHHHGMPILETNLAPEERLWWSNYSTATYFNAAPHTGALWTHILSYTLLYVLVYPLVLVLAGARHRWYLPLLSVHTALVAGACGAWALFAATAPALYPHAAFGPMTAVLFVGAMVHWVAAVLATAADDDDNDDDLFLVHLPDDTLRGLSGDLELEAYPARDPSSSFEVFDADAHLQTSAGAMLPRRMLAVTGLLARFPAVGRVARKVGGAAARFVAVANWASFAYFLIYFPAGVATYAVYGTDGTMFNLLAHWIKGGVFVVLGVVTLARYCGAFRAKGWAWNHRFVAAGADRKLQRQGPGLCTMELVEAGLICFYGATNVFLEHLAAPGGAWTAKDLQHVSIALLFFGFGLCGVLLEVKLGTWRRQRATADLAAVDAKAAAAVSQALPGFSPNPFPTLTIYWMGTLMSLHDQASELSTTIHKQWGNLFVVACLFRVVTYVLCLVQPAPRRLTQSAAPMSELVVAFGLLAGGLVFMESCDPVVHTLEYYGYTAMFTLNLCLCVVALVMAWVMAVFSFKDRLR